jgi:hypothetical protein
VQLAWATAISAAQPQALQGRRNELGQDYLPAVASAAEVQTASLRHFFTDVITQPGPDCVCANGGSIIYVMGAVPGTRVKNRAEHEKRTVTLTVYNRVIRARGTILRSRPCHAEASLHLRRQPAKARGGVLCWGGTSRCALKPTGNCKKLPVLKGHNGARRMVGSRQCWPSGGLLTASPSGYAEIGYLAQTWRWPATHLLPGPQRMGTDQSTALCGPGRGDRSLSACALETLDGLRDLGRFLCNRTPAAGLWRSLDACGSQERLPAPCACRR